MKTCPSCGTGNKDSASFCSGCGRDIRAVTADPSAPRRRMFCTVCGARIADGGKFCPVCGAQQNPQGASAAAPPAGQARYYQPPPAPAAQERLPESAPRTGLLILERVIMGVISTILLCLAARILMKGLPFPFGRRPISSDINLFAEKIGTDLLLIGISTLISVIAASLLGMAAGSGARKASAYLSVVLMAAAFPAALLLVLVFPAFGSLPCPIVSLTMFLTGFLLRSAVMPRKQPGFAGAIGASCAALGTGNGIGLAVGFSVILETYYSLPGTGALLLSGFMRMDTGIMLAGMTGAFVLNGIFRIVFDLIAAACGFRFEKEHIVPEALPGQGRGRNAPTVVFAVLAACLLAAAFIAPLLSRFSPDEIDRAGRMLAPGMNGHLLGTDSMGRDLFARVAAGTRSSLGIAVLSLLIAAVIGGALGTAAGFLKGLARSVLEGIIYVLGFLPVLVIPLMALVMRYSVVSAVLVCAFFWGGIAERLALYIGNLREDRERRLSRSFTPVLEELVFSFCLILFIGTVWSFAGMLLQPPTPALGLILREAMVNSFMTPNVLLIPAAALFLCLLVFGLLQASLFRPDQRKK